MTMVDDEVSRLWGLLTELSTQLSTNREHTESLKKQFEALKAQAVHTGTGFTLRRFNTDITKETFESEVERFNAHLILENQTYLYENKQLGLLLKEYENTMDSIMGKFRSFAHSTQQYELDSARHYENLLLQYSGSSASDSRQPGPSNAPFLQDPVALQMSLAHLSSLLRKALRSLQGEDASDEDTSSSSEDEISESSEASSSDDNNNGGQGKRSKRQTPSNLAPSIVSHRSKSQKSAASHSQSRRKRRDSKHDQGEGGYLRLLSEGLDRADRALERETELERLTRENAELRELLGIARDLPPEPQAETGHA